MITYLLLNFHTTTVTTIQMAYYEALYGRRYKSHIRWFEVSQEGLIGPHLDHQAMEMLKVIQQRLIMTQSPILHICKKNGFRL